MPPNAIFLSQWLNLVTEVFPDVPIYFPCINNVSPTFPCFIVYIFNMIHSKKDFEVDSSMFLY